MSRPSVNVTQPDEPRNQNKVGTSCAKERSFWSHLLLVLRLRMESQGTEPQLTSPGVRAAAVLLQGSVLGGCSAGGLPPLLMALMMAIVGALLCLLRVDPFIWDLLELVCPGLGKPADIIRHTSYESSSDRTALGVLCLSPITCWR